MDQHEQGAHAGHHHHPRRRRLDDPAFGQQRNRHGSKATLWLLADNSGDGEPQHKSRPYAFGSWNLDNGALHWTLRLEKDVLVLESFQISQKDKSLGPNNIRNQEQFKKK